MWVENTAIECGNDDRFGWTSWECSHCGRSWCTIIDGEPPFECECQHALDGETEQEKSCDRQQEGNSAWCNLE